MAVVLPLLCLAIEIALLVVIIAGFWKMFVKAGKPGWAAIVPIYNVVVMLEIVGKPIWWIVLFLIPIANLVVSIILYIELAKCFGKGGGFAVGLILLPFIFVPILGFGDAEYLGAEGSPPPRRKKRRRIEDDDEFDDEDDRPRSRRRSRDDDYDDDRPRSRRRERDDDDDEGIAEERPAKRRRDDDDDEQFRSDEPPRKAVKSAPPSPPPAAAANGAVMIQCAGCQKKLKVPANIVGKKVKCPACGATFVAG